MNMVMSQLPGVFPAQNTYQAFLSYLMQAEFYDGMKSGINITDAKCGAKSGTVDHVFTVDNLNQNGVDLCDTAAMTCSDYKRDGKPMLRVFWDPRAISGDNYGKQDMNIATMFHEALHGFTGLNDPDLQKALGCPQTALDFGPSLNITYYLLQFIPYKVTTSPQACSQVKVPTVDPTKVNCAW